MAQVCSMNWAEVSLYKQVYIYSARICLKRQGKKLATSYYNRIDGRKRIIVSAIFVALTPFLPLGLNLGKALRLPILQPTEAQLSEPFLVSLGTSVQRALDIKDLTENLQQNATGK